MLTYGDGVADIDVSKLLTFHNQHGGLITMTSAQPEGRFGALSLNNESKVLDFKEKPKGDGSWVNAGFFVCDSKVFDYISDKENDVFEERPLEQLAAAGELFAYKHDGFWMPMDTLRDKVKLNELFYKERPWIVWEN
jgi:glucose-1-phosphate cytidylyltransferase